MARRLGGADVVLSALHIGGEVIALLLTLFEAGFFMTGYEGGSLGGR